MRKLLVFQHVPFEPLGTLDKRFREAGFRIRYVNFHRQGEIRVRVERYHGLVVLGGPMSADEIEHYPHLQHEKNAIAEAIALEIPVLGICLGAQLIAATLGGRTLRGVAPEFGWTSVTATAAGREDPLIGQFEGDEQIFQWHSDTFTLPDACTHLARSADCEYQAFRYNDCVYGLQFHLEADRALIRRWLKTPRQLEGVHKRGGALDAGRIVAETDQHIQRAGWLSRQVFGEFINRFYSWRRRLALPSR